MNIGVFCSANNQIDAAFFQQTEELGRWVAKSGHQIVFGGVNQGLMECVARATKEAGGHTVEEVKDTTNEDEQGGEAEIAARSKRHCDTAG